MCQDDFSIKFLVNLFVFIFSLFLFFIVVIHLDRNKYTNGNYHNYMPVTIRNKGIHLKILLQTIVIVLNLKYMQKDSTM